MGEGRFHGNLKTYVNLIENQFFMLLLNIESF